MVVVVIVVVTVVVVVVVIVVVVVGVHLFSRSVFTIFALMQERVAGGAVVLLPTTEPLDDTPDSRTVINAYI